MSLAIASVRLSPYLPSPMPSSPLLFSEQQLRPGAFSPAGRRRGAQGDYGSYECQTCKNRTYQDGSNDPGVSFKTPSRISPESAPYAVRAHEYEHVSRAWAKAQKEGKEVVSQSVTYRTAVCPECGRTYISGGSTRTVFRSKSKPSPEPVEKGVYLNLTA